MRKMVQSDGRQPEKAAHGTDEYPLEIRFYRSNERPYGVLSNLYRCKVVFEGREYETAEHAYQAGKARDNAVRDWILSAPSPSLVAMAAHGLYTWDIAPNWSKTKFNRMRGVVRAKFTQNPPLKQLLLSTGEARLIEAATVDNVVNRTWGEVNGKGKNMLGCILMEVRDELRLEGSNTTSKESEDQDTIRGNGDSAPGSTYQLVINIT